VIVNKMKEKALRGEVVIGTGLGWPDPDLVRSYGNLGFDFFRIEGEHGLVDYKDLDLLCRVAREVDITPSARVPGNVQHEILHYLDRGCLTIYIPHTDSAETARSAVKAAKHHPLGQRGDAYLARASLYGQGLSQEEYYRLANESVMLIALVEDKEGLESIEDIVRVPGVDAIDVGPWDLRQSMGMPDQEKVQAAVERIVEVAVRAGKPVSVGTAMNLDQPERMRFWREKGVTMFLGGNWIGLGVREGMKIFRDAVGH
jgi:4-hydroxy-2-oxoheptanedioate aldolase